MFVVHLCCFSHTFSFQDPKATISLLKNHLQKTQKQLEDEQKRHKKQRDEDAHVYVTWRHIGIKQSPTLHFILNFFTHQTRTRIASVERKNAARRETGERRHRARHYVTQPLPPTCQQHHDGTWAAAIRRAHRRASTSARLTRGNLSCAWPRSLLSTPFVKHSNWRNSY